MFKSYKLVDGKSGNKGEVKKPRPKTGNKQQQSAFDVVRTLAFQDHFNTTKGNEFVKHNYRQPIVDSIPYP